MSSLHHDAIVVDCHNDLPVMLPAHHRKWGKTDAFGSWAIPELRTGGVDVQVLPVYVEPEVAEASLRVALLTIEQLLRDIEANAEQVRLCLNGGDIDATVAEGKIAVILAMEGCAALGADVELFSLLYRLGVRMASFTHFPRTLWGDGSAEEATGGRLSSSGVAAVREMERLGMLVDVSHLSEAGTNHILEIATRPVIASHSSSRALRDHHRNLRDDQLRAIAAGGGVIGVNVIPTFIHEQRDGQTIDHVVDHIQHIADVAGIDHVGLGPDFIFDYFETVYPHLPVVAPIEGVNLKETIPDLAGARDLPNLTDAMLRHDMSDGDIRKVLGENFLRVFREVMGVARA